MKKLTLDETWEQSLAMWKWISRQWTRGRRDVLALKEEWLKKQGYGESEVLRDCFFCQACREICSNCPAVLIDSSFDCIGTDYSYHDAPAFYAKLKELNKIRLEAK